MIDETDELIVCPGVYDGLSARIAIRVGFSALYMVRILIIKHSTVLFATSTHHTLDGCGHHSLSSRSA